MHKYLRQHLICPFCKNELSWNITNEDDTHIMDATILCVKCYKKYFVKNRIGCFLVDFDDTEDNWKKGDDFLTDYFIKCPDRKEKLLSTPVDNLNAADLYARGDYLKSNGDEEEATHLYDLAKNKLSSGKKETGESHISFISNKFQDKKGFIIDVASGMGSLITEFLSKTSMDIISTDISYNVLAKSQSQAKLKNLDKFDRISYIVFDMKAIPFKDKSIKYMTTIAGLQNIIKDHALIIKELYRVCSELFYASCGFYFENDTIHKDALEKFGMDKFWFKSRLITEFEKFNWRVNCEMSVITKSKPTPFGEIVEGYGIDSFPIVETESESCVMTFAI